MSIGSIFYFDGDVDICAFPFAANVRSGHLPAGYTVVLISLLDVRTAVNQPVSVAARSKAYLCGRSPAQIVGSNPIGAWMFVCCECCVLSGRCLCVGLITRTEESYRLWCVVECDLETA